MAVGVMASARLPAIVGKASCQKTKVRAIEIQSPLPENISIVNSEKAIELEGTIMMVLPGTMFRVALANDHLVLAHFRKDAQAVHSAYNRRSSENGDVALRHRESSNRLSTLTCRRDSSL